MADTNSTSQTSNGVPPPSPPARKRLTREEELELCRGLTERERMTWISCTDGCASGSGCRSTTTTPGPPDEYFGPDERQELLAKVFGITLEQIKQAPIEIEPPFYVDYGTNITFEGSFYANMDLIILDGAPVKLGTRILCGPRVGIYAATHSTDVDERQGGYERAYPIEIGDDCWIGGGAIINCPTKIGKGCTVAGGAVVRGDFPDYCVIGGVPAKVIKMLDPPKGTFDLSKYR